MSIGLLAHVIPGGTRHVDRGEQGSRRSLLEEVGRGNAAVVDQLFAEDFVDHIGDGPPGTRESHRGMVTMFRGALPDLLAEIEDQVAGEDQVVTRRTWRGTHRGEFPGIPATGREVTIPTVRIDRISGTRSQRTGSSSTPWDCSSS